MRSREYTVAGRTFTFPFYGSHVGVNVKCHHTPNPIEEDTLRLWRTLSEATKENYIQQAWDRVQSEWWDALKDLPHRAASDGRSGGYAVFPRLTDSFISEICDDAENAACDKCNFVDVPEHVWAQEKMAQPQLLLPIPQAVWDLECLHCGSPYSDHTGLRCPWELGRYYEPHRYTNSSLVSLEEIEQMVADVEKRADATELASWLDQQLEDVISEDWGELEDKGSG